MTADRPEELRQMMAHRLFFIFLRKLILLGFCRKIPDPSTRKI